MKCKRDSDGRSLDHVSLQTMRIQAVKAIENGQTPEAVAAAYGVNVRSVFRWMASYANGGQKALQAKPIPGRPPKLDEREMRWLASTVRNTTPQQHRFAFALWTLSLIADVLERERNIRLSRSAVGRAMRALGFTAQRPLQRARERDAVLVERWEREEFPAIAAEAKRTGARIYFADEAGMRSDHHAGTTWAPIGRTPQVSKTGQRFSLNMLSAVNATGKFHFMLHDGRVTAEVFVEFLRRLMHDAERPVILVVDGHSTHKAKLVREFVEAQQGRLKLVFLPPYSPHLNPDEQVWGNVKARVAKQAVTDKRDLQEKLTAALERLCAMPQLIAGFFRHPHCRYILDAQGGVLA
jgi:transposase